MNDVTPVTAERHTALMAEIEAETAAELLRKLFPGAKVSDWTPAGKERPKTQYERAAEAVVGWFGEHPEIDANLTPADAMRLIGIKDRARFRKIRQHEEFRFMIQQAGLMDQQGFCRIFGTTHTIALVA